MKSLEQTDLSQLTVDKTFLLIQVDECFTSTPFIENGYEIAKHLFEKLKESMESYSETLMTVDDADTIEQFWNQLAEECGSDPYYDLDELGYSIYKLPH
jgi:hypothetical protein